MEKRKVVCECVNVVRSISANNNGWDSTRGCIKYTAIMRPKGNESDSLLCQMDLFLEEFRCPITDTILRTRAENATKAAKDTDPDEKQMLWDNVVKAALIGQQATVSVVTASVSELTGGKYTSYSLEIGGSTLVVTARTICALGDIERRIANVANHVLADCEKQNVEEQA